MSKKKNTRPKSRLKPEQYEALRPYFPVMALFNRSGSFAGGDLEAMDAVAQAIGEPKTDLWCAGCCKGLIRTMIAEVLNYDEATFDNV